MPIAMEQAKLALLRDLNARQEEAVGASERALLVIAGAGSGKTEVMTRRVAWWVAVEGVPKDQIVAFTFTEAAADELEIQNSYVASTRSPRPMKIPHWAACISGPFMVFV